MILSLRQMRTPLPDCRPHPWEESWEQEVRTKSPGMTKQSSLQNTIEKTKMSNLTHHSIDRKMNPLEETKEKEYPERVLGELNQDMIGTTSTSARSTSSSKPIEKELSA